MSGTVDPTRLCMFSRPLVLPSDWASSERGSAHLKRLIEFSARRWEGVAQGDSLSLLPQTFRFFVCGLLGNGQETRVTLKDWVHSGCLRGIWVHFGFDRACRTEGEGVYSRSGAWLRSVPVKCFDLKDVGLV